MTSTEAVPEGAPQPFNVLSTVDVKALGSVIVNVSVCKQLCASVTLTVYVPADKLVTEGTV